MMKKTLWSLCLCTTLAMAGCGEDEEGGGGPSGSELRGVYDITAWTENEAGCDAQGDSVLEQRGNKKMLVQACTLNFGISVTFLQAIECVDEADCEEKRCTGDSLNLGGWSFESGSDDKGWVGESAFVFSSGEEALCSGDVNRFVLKKGEGEGELLLESRKVLVQDIPKDADDFCDTDAASRAATSRPCAALEVITMRLAP